MQTVNTKVRLGGYLSETPIKIRVGKEEATYHAHSGVLSACKSSTAGVRLTGHWKDAGCDTIDWTAFDRQTVECVLQYLYTGDYHVPESQEEVPAANDEGGDTTSEKTQDKEPKADPTSSDKPAELSQNQVESRVSLRRPLTPVESCIRSGPPVHQVQTAAGLEAENIQLEKPGLGISILTHAKVYAFADQNFYSDLKTMALQRLTQIFTRATCDPTTMFPYLADAIRHIYDTTPGPDIHEDPARKLFSQYVALNYTSLIGLDFDALAGEGGEFWTEMLPKMARLIYSTELELLTNKKQVGHLLERIRLLEDDIYKIRNNQGEGSERKPLKSNRKHVFRASVLNSHYDNY